MPREKELVFVEDRVNGFRSTYVDLERVPREEVPADAEVDGEVYRLVHIPFTAGKRAAADYLLNKLPRTLRGGLERVTDTMYPAGAIDGPKLWPHGAPESEGGMEKVIILHEDIYGNSPYADFIGESRENSLADLQGRAEKSEAEAELRDLDVEEQTGDTDSDGGLDELPGRSPQDRERGGRR